MRKKQINTGKSEILLVELPDGGYNVQLHSQDSTIIIWESEDSIDGHWDTIPEGNWSILSRADEVTNGDLGGVVKSIPHHIGFHRVYKDYKGKYTFPSESYVFENQVESLDSLYASEQVYWENPVKHPKQMYMTPASFSWYKSQVERHEQAQQKVWDKSRTYILIKK